MDPVTTINEKVGNVILGAHLVHCHHNTKYNTQRNLVLVRNPLVSGKGGLVQWTKHETKPGGWKRDVPMLLNTDAADPTRATSQFKVLSVKMQPVTTGRDSGYGGGPEITVKRLDGTGERIRYTRRCCFTTDIAEPAVLVTP